MPFFYFPACQEVLTTYFRGVDKKVGVQILLDLVLPSGVEHDQGLYVGRFSGGRGRGGGMLGIAFA